MDDLDEQISDIRQHVKLRVNIVRQPIYCCQKDAKLADQSVLVFLKVLSVWSKFILLFPQKILSFFSLFLKLLKLNQILNEN